MGAVVRGTDSGTDDRLRLVLTPHPLQRVGAYALAALARPRPEDAVDVEGVDAEGFARAMEIVARNAARAALKESKAPDGFWQKVSLSFFPNSPMNHPGRRKGKNDQGLSKSDADVMAAVRAWLSEPEGHSPGVDCVLCGRAAVGFYGKRDVALAQSEAYRNTTPRGHEGMALCWPCVASFYALPYGCQLTGGSSVALHSWAEPFLANTIARQVARNLVLAEFGREADKDGDRREIVALRALRAYAQPLTDGVEMLVFNNNNRGQLLDSYSLTQPLAEWLRRSSRISGRRAGFEVLVRAHTTENVRGLLALARNAFRDPARVVSRGVQGMALLLGRQGSDPVVLKGLAKLLTTFAIEVMQVNEADLAEIRSTGHKVAAVLSADEGLGSLRELRAKVRSPKDLRLWLTRQAVVWAGVGSGAQDVRDRGPLVSERGFVLLFDPGSDNAAWLHRDLLLVTVLEELARLGWSARGAEEPDETLADMDAEDRRFLAENDSDDEEDQ